MLDKMFRKYLRSILIVSALMLGPILLACSNSNTSSAPQGNNGAASTEPSREQPPKTAFERDLQFIRNGQFTYVYVFARPDRKPIDKDDGAYLRANAPQVVDWVTTDEGKRVIAGTNFNLAEGNLSLLKKRFVVEDYSGR
jgi:phosphate-selective porin